MGRGAVRVTVDTNILVRAAVRDDAAQTAIADRILGEAELVAVPLPCLCEFVWVLRRGYRVPPDRIAGAIRLLVNASNVATSVRAVEAGLRVLDAGGDFADGVIASEGQRLGGDTFVSFDREAVELTSAHGLPALLAR